VAGETYSTDFPVISTGARILQDTNKAGPDAFITKMASPPVTTTSYYVSDMTTLASLGTTLGIHDRDTPGAQDNLVILDFGNPSKRQGPPFDYGTIQRFDSTFLSVSYITSVAVQFAMNYDGNADSASSLRLVIGTSNYGVATHSDLPFWEGHGNAWAAMVNSIQDQVADCCSQVTVVVGSDMEPEWNTPANTKGWLDSYKTASICLPLSGEAGCLYNYGTNPCTSVCGDEEDPWPFSLWEQDDIWYISWGVKKNPTDLNTFARPLPEIYHTSQIVGDGDANRWQILSDYSVTVKQAGRIYFVGSLTTYARESSWNSPDKGWMELWNALFSSSTTRPTALRYSTDIKGQKDK
jgi:hypothetical protein